MASPRSPEQLPIMGGGSSTARLASSTSRRAPDLASGDPERAVVAPPPVSHLPCPGDPRSREQRPSTGDGSSTAHLASSTSRQAPDLASGDPEQGVVGPPPISHLPCHDEPPISRATTYHGRWQFHCPSRVLHVTANPSLASNDPAQAVPVPPPVSRPPRHGEPPDIVSKDPAWGG